MVALNPAYAPCKSIDTVKNRVGDFFCESVDRVGSNRLAAQQPRLENELSFTMTASGLPFFINADPIGFAGGMNWFAYAGGNPISNIDPSGYVFGTPLTYGEFFSAAGEGAAHGAKVYGKGLAVGAVTGVVVVGGAAAAVAVGVPAAVVTGTLFVGATAGAIVTGYDIYKDPSLDNITYNAGALAGGFLVGGAVAKPLGVKLSPSTHRQSVANPTLKQEFSMRWRGSDGETSLSTLLFKDFGTAMGTGPTFGATAGSVGFISSGISSSIK